MCFYIVMCLYNSWVVRRISIDRRVRKEEGMVDKISIEEVIVVETTRGSGGSNDPVRKVIEYWSKEEGGTLLACLDPNAPCYNEQIGGWDLKETDLIQVDGVILGVVREIEDGLNEAHMVVDFVVKDEWLSKEFRKFKNSSKFREETSMEQPEPLKTFEELRLDCPLHYTQGGVKNVLGEHHRCSATNAVVISGGCREFNCVALYWLRMYRLFKSPTEVKKRHPGIWNKLNEF